MDVRASDSERDATVEQLRDAAVEGRLTLEELTDRIEAASHAVARSELMTLTTDLPVAVGRSHPEPADVRKVGDIKRNGPWVVPADSRLRSYFGAIIVDLREAPRCTARRGSSLLAARGSATSRSCTIGCGSDFSIAVERRARSRRPSTRTPTATGSPHSPPPRAALRSCPWQGTRPSSRRRAIASSQCNGAQCSGARGKAIMRGFWAPSTSEIERTCPAWHAECRAVTPRSRTRERADPRGAGVAVGLAELIGVRRSSGCGLTRLGPAWVR